MYTVPSCESIIILKQKVFLKIDSLSLSLTGNKPVGYTAA